VGITHRKEVIYMNVGEAIAKHIISNMHKQQDDIDNGLQVITECIIVEGRYENTIVVAASIDGWCEDVIELRTYYNDELSFTADEFIGMTIKQAEKHILDADVRYLQS
jgi:hypothetical protein